MKVKSILVSQPKPVDFEKSPYSDISKKFDITVDFEKFIKIEDVPVREFRQSKVSLADYTAVIMTSRNAVDHFFRIAKELRYEVPETMKYFCVSESTAFYLQKHITYRKRRIFYGKQTFGDLLEIIKKHRKDEKFLLPCSDIAKENMADVLTEAKIDFSKAILYRTVASDLSHINIDNYDMLVFFSPAGIKSLVNNFPKFKQKNVVIGAFGAGTSEAVKELGFNLNFNAPTKTAPSMTMAIEQFLELQNKKSKKK